MRAVVLQRLMGHTDISVTLNTYASVLNRYKESELEKVNNYYMNNYIFLNQSIEKDNYISEKRENLIKLMKMAEDEAIKGIISISEYRANIEFLKKREQFLYEEKGELVR